MAEPQDGVGDAGDLFARFRDNDGSFDPYKPLLMGLGGVSKEELIAVSNALSEALSGPTAVDDHEFQSRMGISRADAKALFGRIKDDLKTIQ